MGDTTQRSLAETIVKILVNHIALVKGENSQYSDSQDFLVWSWAAVNQISVQESSEQLQECGYDVPCGDTVLDRLTHQPLELLTEGFDTLLQDLLTRARKQRLFTHASIGAIDFTDLPWYGEELPFIVKGKPKKGTNTFIRFATIAVVEDGKRFTLKAVPVTPFSSKEKIVQDLIAYAEKLVDLRVVLFDRGFYTNQVVQTVNEMDEEFVMPAVKNEKVKATMEQAYQEGPLPYEMSDGATYTMVVARDEEQEKLLPYATNMDIDATTAHELYSHRFGIETQYRVKNNVLGNTCSKKHRFRYAFFVLALALYNLWILINIAERGRQGLNPGTIPLKLDRLQHLFRRYIYEHASTSTPTITWIE